MLVTAWALYLTFGLMGIYIFFKFWITGLNKIEVNLMVISLLIGAISAGVLWGGLKL